MKARDNARFRRKARGLLLTRLLARDGDKCALCGLTLDRHLRDELHPDYVTLDHIVPHSSGGADDFSNLRLAHKRCNETRPQGAIPVWPWAE